MSFSLNSALRTCKVDSGYAANFESQRFLNPAQMVCPPWSGFDSAGRQVCADSFYTKSPGCNSPADRVDVENYLRPQYFQYITLDAEGLQGNLYSTESAARTRDVRDARFHTGNFGSDFGAFTRKQCPGPTSVYAQGQAQISEQMRRMQAMQQGYQSNAYRQASGF